MNQKLMNTNKNILLAIEWIENQITKPTMKLNIDNYCIIHDLNNSLSVNLYLLKHSKGVIQRSAYIRTRMIKNYLTKENNLLKK